MGIISFDLLKNALFLSLAIKEFSSLSYHILFLFLEFPFDFQLTIKSFHISAEKPHLFIYIVCHFQLDTLTY